MSRKVTMHASSRWKRTRLILAFAVSVLVACPALVPGTTGLTPAGASSPGYTIEVTPSTNLVDGQTIDVVLRAEPGHRLGESGIVRACREAATYTTSNDVNPFVGGNCPDRPVSSSASQPWPIRAYPDGTVALTKFRVGTGTVQWGPAVDPTQFSLTCDPTQPCRLVIVFNLDGPEVIDSSTVLTFGTDSPLGACGGSEADPVVTAGPDRLTAAWVSWTRSKCVAEGSKATTQAVLAGEGDGQKSFADGLADLTYSAVGPGFPGGTAGTRSSTSVPLALNAAVVGVLGGYGSTATDWPKGVPKPYQNLGVTMPEMATLFGQGRYMFEAYHFDPMQQRNPELANALSLTNNDRGNPIAPAGGDATTWLATRAFDTLADAQWKTPPQQISGNTPDVPRGVHESLALANPSFTISLFELYSSQGQLKRLAADFEFKPYSYGPIWILTDLATARALRIPTVALQNSLGEFVQPTDDSLRAAVPSLGQQADGTLVPTIGNDAAGAYPLTFVEHAVVPTEPLLDATCAERPETQRLLADWLGYLTGAGQDALPDGLVRLTPDLASGTAASIARVGAATPTGACAPSPDDPSQHPAPPPDVEGLPLSSVSSGDLPVGAPPAASDASGGSAGAGSATAGGTDPSAGGAAAGQADTAPPDSSAPRPRVEVAEISYPGLPPGTSPNGVVMALALVAIAGLGALGGAASSGHRLRSSRSPIEGSTPS